MSARLKRVEGRIENVDLEALHIDPAYQRAVKPHSRVIANDFNPAAASTLHVGQRSDGSLWLIDGQQRRWAMLENGIKAWKAWVIHSDGPRFEAAVYDLLNGGRTRKSLTAMELFAARLTAEDPTALAVKRAVESAGLKLRTYASGNAGWPHLRCVGSLYAKTAIHGEATAARALADMAAAWPQSDDCMSETIPTSMIILYGRAGQQIDSARMVDQLSRVPPRNVLHDSATATGNRYAACQEVLVGIYNRRLGLAKRLRLTRADEPDAA